MPGAEHQCVIGGSKGEFCSDEKRPLSWTVRLSSDVPEQMHAKGSKGYTSAAERGFKQSKQLYGAPGCVMLISAPRSECKTALTPGRRRRRRRAPRERISSAHDAALTKSAFIYKSRPCFQWPLQTGVTGSSAPTRALKLSLKNELYNCNDARREYGGRSLVFGSVCPGLADFGTHVSQSRE